MTPATNGPDQTASAKGFFVSRRVLLGLGAALLVAVGIGIVVTYANTPIKILTTKALIFTPFTTVGLSNNVSVVARGTGSCWEGSVAVLGDRNAWRCTQGNEILDPCFSSPYNFNLNYVACAGNPWSGIKVIRLSAPLPTSIANSSNGANLSSAWALQLGNGDHCVVGTGENAIVSGIIMDYYCISGAVAGSLDNNRQPWTIEYLPKGSDTISAISVRSAWAG